MCHGKLLGTPYNRGFSPNLSLLWLKIQQRYIGTTKIRRKSEFSVIEPYLSLPLPSAEMEEVVAAFGESRQVVPSADKTILALYRIVTVSGSNRL